METTCSFNQSKLLEFIDSKKDLYNEFEFDYVRNTFLHGRYDEVKRDEGIREVLDETGLLPDEDNIYKYFTDFILSRCDINNKRIIEVGGGVFGRLSKRLSLKQQNGVITIYDPRLDPTMKSDDRLIFKKEKFTRCTDVSDTDLLVGLMPCEGANPLVEQAIKYDKDFILWLCEGGPHGDIFDYFEDADEWMDSLLYFASSDLEEKGKKLYIKKEERLSPYPIITNV